MPLLANKTTLRWWTKQDIPMLARIEKECHSAAWTVEEFQGLLNQVGTCCRIAERDGGAPVGFCIYSVGDSLDDNHTPRRIQLLNLAVLPSARRQGIGSLLLDYPCKRLGVGRYVGVDTHVHERDLAAQLFLRQAGFKAARVVRGFYVDGDAAYLMYKGVAPSLT